MRDMPGVSIKLESMFNRKTRAILASRRCILESNATLLEIANCVPNTLPIITRLQVLEPLETKLFDSTPPREVLLIG